MVPVCGRRGMKALLSRSCLVINVSYDVPGMGGLRLVAWQEKLSAQVKLSYQNIYNEMNEKAIKIYSLNYLYICIIDMTLP